MYLFRLGYTVAFYNGDEDDSTGVLFVEADDTLDASAKAETALAELLGSFAPYASVETEEPQFIQGS